MKEKSNKILTFLVVLVLIIIAVYFLAISYKEGKEKNTNNLSEEKHEKVYTDDGYLVIDYNLDKENAVKIDEVKKSEDNSFEIKGTLLSRYKVTENEYDYFKNQEPLVVNGENFYYTWSDEVNEYIYISKKSDDVYYLEKDKDSDEYFVNKLGDTSYVYEETDEKVIIKVDENVDCEIVGKDTETAKRLFEQEEITYGTYVFEFKNGKCTKVKCNLK